MVWLHEQGCAEDFNGAPDTCWAVACREAGSPPDMILWQEIPPFTGYHKTIAIRAWIDDEGWMEWPGGECPVQNEWADVILRGGRFFVGRPARYTGGHWRHMGNSSDIIAWRIDDRWPHMPGHPAVGYEPSGLVKASPHLLACLEPVDEHFISFLNEEPAVAGRLRRGVIHGRSSDTQEVHIACGSLIFPGRLKREIGMPAVPKKIRTTGSIFIPAGSTGSLLHHMGRM